MFGQKLVSASVEGGVGEGRAEQTLKRPVPAGASFAVAG
jgi:hypothetical protein